MLPIDERILELKSVEKDLAELNDKKESLRKEIFGIIENEGLTDGYKNKEATVSYVERRTVKIKDEAKLLEDLTSQKIVKYYQEIPTHFEFTEKLKKDAKEGVFSHPEIEVEIGNNLAIRFAE